VKGGLLYRSVGWLLVRTPLLPVEEYLALGERSGWPVDTASGTLLPADPRVHRALAVGGGDLARALERPVSGDRARQRLAEKIIRYLIRMSTRPTPYGMYAGVGLGAWGEHTNLALAAEKPRTRTRPDMGWLLAMVGALESRPEVRAGLRWFTNPAAIIHGDRVFLTERAPHRDASGPGQAVSLRATEPVRRALALARTPVPYPRLVDDLMTTPGATLPKVERLIEQLWEQTVLLTDLRPPLTIEDPARYVVQRLADIPATRADAAALTELLEAMSNWDRLDIEEGAANYPKLIAQAQSVYPTETADGPIQVDMALPLAGRYVNRAVAVEAARAGEMLLRLSPLPHGPPSLDAYRRAFDACYGPDREVPILELLNPELGLGPPGHTPGGGLDGRRQLLLRQQTLRDLALDAIRDRRLVVELDESTLARLETWQPSPGTAPTSLEISVFVIATSVNAVDAGDFQVVVGPNLGASAAGRNLGRFADLIGREAHAMLTDTAQAEAVARPGRLWAEVVYLPRRARSANVAIRPLVRDRQVVFDTVPGSCAQPVIPVDELVVSVRNGRFVVRWPALDLDLMPCAGHMLTSRQASPVVRFLDDVGRDGRPQLSSFDWGPAAGFPFLPRVQIGRVVLTPATWRIDPTVLPAKTADAFADSLAVWRERWQVPRYVYLTAGDNRLLLDLHSRAQSDQLRAEIRGLSTSGQLVLQEALPAPVHAWLPGANGYYISELVVPVVLNSVQPAPERTPIRARTGSVTSPATRHLRPPGSDWLFAKLYHLATFEEDLIAGPIRSFCAEALAAGQADNWFFLRYSDPERHLRVRLHGDPELLATQLAPKLFRWASKLIADGYCRRLCIDTYDQEVQRYGGATGMAVSETLFAVDSRAVVDLLHLGQPGPALDRTLIAALSVDELLAGLGFDEAKRADWYRQEVSNRRNSGGEYRHRQANLRSLLGDPDWLLRQHGGGEVARVLAPRRASIELLARRLDDLIARGELGQPMHRLARSFVHLHCNRLLGAGHATEQQVLGLLLRARESLLRAPLKRGLAPKRGCPE
jgi:thiopeptide-type bacteriocin biosynthesis protein